MLTWGEAVEVHALRERGWSISAIANHLGRDRKTIRAYVNGEREPGRRRSQAPDPLVPFVDYLVARFADDPHVWASALYDEVARLGYRLSGGAAEAASSHSSHRPCISTRQSWR
jgi:transposase